MTGHFSRREWMRAVGISTLFAPAAGASLAKSKPLPAGPFAPTWDSIREHYRLPDWLEAAKFGIFIHWGLYAGREGKIGFSQEDAGLRLKLPEGGGTLPYMLKVSGRGLV